MSEDRSDTSESLNSASSSSIDDVAELYQAMPDGIADLAAQRRIVEPLYHLRDRKYGGSWIPLIARYDQFVAAQKSMIDPEIFRVERKIIGRIVELEKIHGAELVRKYLLTTPNAA